MADKSPSDKPQTENTLLGHLIELRGRLIIAVGTLMAGFLICYVFAEHIYTFLARPLADALEGQEQRSMIFTGLTEAFFTYIRVSLWGGLMLSAPVIISQMWLFVAPGLYKQEKRMLLPFLLATPVLFVLGSALAYYFVFPLAWQFFISFEIPAAASGDSLPIQLQARVSEYLSLVMSLLFAFGLAFQLPVLLILLTRVGVCSAKGLKRWRKYAIVFSFAAAALLTPPDLISQVSLAVPLLVLYELSIWGAVLVERRRTTASSASSASPSPTTTPTTSQRSQ